MLLAVPLLVVVTLLSLTTPTRVAQKTTLYHPPRIIVKQGLHNSTSTNWSGYGAEKILGSSIDNNSISDVKTTWVVPNVTCNSGQANGYSSSWVGIDGYDDNSVEQTGTEQDCINGSANFYAWFEMYPKPSYLVTNYAVVPGDTVTAEVKYVGNGTYVLSLDSSRSGHFEIRQKSMKALRRSADYIVEAPFSGGTLPLAQFGTISFSNSNAVVNGTPNTIGSLNYDAITMVDKNNNSLATPSALTNGGTGFTVTRK